MDEAFFTLAREIKKRLLDTTSASASERSPTSAAGGSGSVNVGQGQGNQEKGGCC